MITHKTKWLLVGLVCLALWPAHASAQGGLWETYAAAGVKAYQQGNYPEAEKYLAAAVKEAEGFGPQDPRLATSLNNLAGLYHAQGKYAEAEPLHKRALAIREKALGTVRCRAPFVVPSSETGRGHPLKSLDGELGYEDLDCFRSHIWRGTGNFWMYDRDQK